MSQVSERPDTRDHDQATTDEIGRAALALPIWRLNLLRAGYLVLGAGLAVEKWPGLLDSDQWELKEGTVECLLAATSFLALLGLRDPHRMLPILLFEVTWKVIWLAVVALPLWLDDELHGATRDQAGAVLWVVFIIVVIPWRHIGARYVRATGEPWRRQLPGTPATERGRS